MNKGLTAMKYFIFLLFTLFMLVGCSTTHNQVVDDKTLSGDKNKNWTVRQHKLAALSRWQLQARASVTYRNENWPFDIEWQQKSPAQYTMLIKHPLTKNELAKIVKTSNTVSLISNGRLYQDSSAEQLIEKHLRVKLPVKGMRYWVRGIASPDYQVISVSLDNNGRPLTLQQAGWNILYSKYNSGKRDALPTLIKVSRSIPQPVQVKMRIRQWR
jgi:outer membrane lipoprotein LolB